MTQESKSMAMARAMSGDLAGIIKEKTGIDARGLVDPRPAYLIDKIRRRAKARGLTHALDLLDEAERQLVIDQGGRMSSILQEDISKLGLMTGNKETKGSPLSDILGG